MFNEKKIQELKQVAQQAAQAHEDEKARLAGLGLKSQERYILLKELKKVMDAANSEYVKFAHKEIKSELDKIIVAAK